MTINSVFPNDGKKQFEKAKVTVHVSDRDICIEAVAVPGKLLEWMGVLRMGMASKEDIDFYRKVANDRLKLTEAELKYLPPNTDADFTTTGAVWRVMGLDEQANSTDKKGHLHVASSRLAPSEPRLEGESGK